MKTLDFTSTCAHDSHFIIFGSGGGKLSGHVGHWALESGHHFERI